MRVQGRTNTEALQVLFPLQRVMAYDARREATAAFATHVQGALDLEVEVVDTPRAAVEGCDLVVTGTWLPL